MKNVLRGIKDMTEQKKDATMDVGIKSFITAIVVITWIANGNGYWKPLSKV